MRIAVVVPHFPAVASTFILSQIVGLIERGHDVMIFAGRPPIGEPVHHDVSRYALIEKTSYFAALPTGAIARAMAAARLIALHLHKAPAQLMRSIIAVNYHDKPPTRGLLSTAVAAAGKGPFDIVHCHFGPIGLLGLSLRTIGLLPGKLICSFHGNELKSSSDQRGPVEYARLFASCDALTANSDYTRRRMIETGCPADRIELLREGMDIEHFPFRPRRLTQGQSVRLVTVGRLHEMKGIEYSIRAVALVAQSYPDIEYDIVGDGPLRTHLLSVIRELQMEHKIRLLGWRSQEDVRAIYDRSSLFMLTSVTTSEGAKEAQGVVLCEAQAMGLPVITSASGGIPETVVDGQTGFLVPERDVTAIAAKLKYLLGNQELWPEMGRKGRLFVEKHFASNLINDQLVKLYDRVHGLS